MWDGEAVKVGRFAGAMRRFLMKEHLGLLGGGEEDGDRGRGDRSVLRKGAKFNIKYCTHLSIRAKTYSFTLWNEDPLLIF